MQNQVLEAGGSCNEHQSDADLGLPLYLFTSLAGHIICTYILRACACGCARVRERDGNVAEIENTSNRDRRDSMYELGAIAL